MRATNNSVPLSRSGSQRSRGFKGVAIGTSLAVIASIGIAATVASPAAAASYVVGDGVEALGVVATGANGGSATGYPGNYNVPGGRGAAVTAVVDSGFTAGDSIDTTIGTGGAGRPMAGENGAGGGLTLVHNTTSSTDLVIAGGGGGSSRIAYNNSGTLVGVGGDGGTGVDGAGGDGTGRDATSGGKGGAAGTGGAGGINDGSVCSDGSAGGAINGGNGSYPYGISPGPQGAQGSVGGNASDLYWDCGTSGGAGYGGGGGGSSKRFTGGESGSLDYTGGGGAGGSFSIGSERVFEQNEENADTPGSPGLAGDALVTWIKQSQLDVQLGLSQGEVVLSWDTPGFAHESDQLGDLEYEIYRDGTLVTTSSSSTYIDRPGSGVHTYQIKSVAPLNSKEGTLVGDLITASEDVDSPDVPFVDPTITTISPATGPTAGGTSITITGTGFISDAVVTVGGDPCTNVVVNDTGTSITCSTPPRPQGNADVVITNPDASAVTKVNGFNYSDSVSPVIASVGPTSGPAAGGTRITITGSGFEPGATVRIGGSSCKNIVVNDSGTKITCTTPKHNAGKASVTVINPGNQRVTKPRVFSFIGVPKKPASLTVGPRNLKAKSYTARWKAPSNSSGARPTQHYRIQLNRFGCSKLIVNKKLKNTQTSYKFSRSFLLKNSTCKRGELGGAVRYRVKVIAVNSSGSGPASTANFAVRR